MDSLRQDRRFAQGTAPRTSEMGRCRDGASPIPMRTAKHQREAVIIRLPVRPRPDPQPVVSEDACLVQNTLIVFPFGAVTRSERQAARRRSTRTEIRQVHAFEQRRPTALAPADWEGQ